VPKRRLSKKNRLPAEGGGIQSELAAHRKSLRADVANLAREKERIGTSIGEFASGLGR